MTEDEARAWLESEISVSRETMVRLESFIAFLKREMASQNLISASTVDSIWVRHIVDGAQLLPLAPSDQSGGWVDLGSGAGFPGIVVALLSDWRVTLVESRARRIDYLKRAVSLLDLEDRVAIEGRALERVQTAPFSVISARAFAPLPRLFTLASRFSTDKTRWLLPKGRNAAKELAEIQPLWHSDFNIMPSITDDDAGILVGHLLGARGKASETSKNRR